MVTEKISEPIEKPIVLYYAKYIGVSGTNKSLPIDEGVYVRIYDDRIDIDFLKSKGPRTIIHYDEMIDMQHIDAGNKFDLERVIGLGVLRRNRKYCRSFMEKAPYCNCDKR